MRSLAVGGCRGENACAVGESRKRRVAALIGLKVIDIVKLRLLRLQICNLPLNYSVLYYRYQIS